MLAKLEQLPGEMPEHFTYLQILITTVHRVNEKPCDVDLAPWMSKMTLDVLGNSIFNYDFGNLDGKIDKYYDAYQNIFNFTFSRLLLVYVTTYDIMLEFIFI